MLVIFIFFDISYGYPMKVAKRNVLTDLQHSACRRASMCVVLLWEVEPFLSYENSRMKPLCWNLTVSHRLRRNIKVNHADAWKKFSLTEFRFLDNHFTTTFQLNNVRDIRTAPLIHLMELKGCRLKLAINIQCLIFCKHYKIWLA